MFLVYYHIVGEIGKLRTIVTFTSHVKYIAYNLLQSRSRLSFDFLVHGQADFVIADIVRVYPDCWSVK